MVTFIFLGIPLNDIHPDLIEMMKKLDSIFDMLVAGGEAKLLVIEFADMEIEHLGYA
jgi:hypothetical protein